MKIWTDKWPFTAEAKGTSCKPDYDHFLVTSNYTIEDIYGPEPTDSDKVRKAKEVLVRAISARFIVIKVESRAEC